MGHLKQLKAGRRAHKKNTKKEKKTQNFNNKNK